MVAIVGPGGPSMATKSAIDGPGGPVVAGDHLRRDSTLNHYVYVASLHCQGLSLYTSLIVRVIYVAILVEYEKELWFTA